MSAPRRSTWPPRPRHQTISRTAAPGAFPSVITGLRSDFIAAQMEPMEANRTEERIPSPASLRSAPSPAMRARGRLSATAKPLSCTAGEGGTQPARAGWVRVCHWNLTLILTTRADFGGGTGSPEYQALGALGRLDQFEPALDPLKPAIDVVEAHRQAGIIGMEPGDLTLEPT